MVPNKLWQVLKSHPSLESNFPRDSIQQFFLLPKKKVNPSSILFPQRQQIRGFPGVVRRVFCPFLVLQKIANLWHGGEQIYVETFLKFFTRDGGKKTNITFNMGESR